MLYAVSRATVPKITVVIRKAYGAGYYVMNGRAYEPDLIVAWPGAEISVMGAEGAVNIIFRKQIEAAEDPEATRKEMVDNFKAIIDPYIAAGQRHGGRHHRPARDAAADHPRARDGRHEAGRAAVEEARRDAGVTDSDVDVIRDVERRGREGRPGGRRGASSSGRRLGAQPRGRARPRKASTGAARASIAAASSGSSSRGSTCARSRASIDRARRRRAIASGASCARSTAPATRRSAPPTSSASRSGTERW